MTRRHGISSDTYGKLILDSGAIYTNYVDLNNLGALLGATRGGATFKREPTYIDLPFEGIPGQVKGQKHLTGVKCTLDVSIISFDTTNLGLAIPNSSVLGFSENQIKITEKEWNVNETHSLTNIAIIAEISGESDPVVIVLDNPICESDFSLPLQDKSEAVSQWTFSAFYDENSNFETPPWRIYWPGTVSITDIIETGLADINYIETGTTTDDIIEDGL